MTKVELGPGVLVRVNGKDDLACHAAAKPLIGKRAVVVGKVKSGMIVIEVEGFVGRYQIPKRNLDVEPT